jgi:hypothetical protein
MMKLLEREGVIVRKDKPFRRTYYQRPPRVDAESLATTFKRL